MAKTWRTKSGIVMFHLAMPSRGAPVAAIRRATAACLRHATLVGTPRDLEVSTRSGGEAAYAWSDVADGGSVAHRLASYPDLTGVVIRCDLECEDGDGGSFVVPVGMTFWAQLADLDSMPIGPIELNLTLDTDVYLARSWGDERDNRELAMRNAPRFNRFLANLRRSTGATMDGVSADDYPGQVDATGVVLSVAGGRS